MTILRPNDQSFLLLSSIHFPNLVFRTLFPRSTSPCDCGCRGLPFIIFVAGQIVIKSLITWEVNSFPLSDCNIAGAPKVVNSSNKLDATSSDAFVFRGYPHENLLKWSRA